MLELQSVDQGVVIDNAAPKAKDRFLVVRRTVSDGETRREVLVVGMEVAGLVVHFAAVDELQKRKGGVAGCAGGIESLTIYLNYRFFDFTIFDASELPAPLASTAPLDFLQTG